MGGTDEKQNEYKSLRTRREPATAPAWALSWGIEMAKTENRKPKRGLLRRPNIVFLKARCRRVPTLCFKRMWFRGVGCGMLWSMHGKFKNSRHVKIPR